MRVIPFFVRFERVSNILIIFIYARIGRYDGLKFAFIIFIVIFVTEH